jgi:hypothetical protein
MVWQATIRAIAAGFLKNVALHDAAAFDVEPQAFSTSWVDGEHHVIGSSPGKSILLTSIADSSISAGALGSQPDFGRQMPTFQNRALRRALRC